MYHLVVAVLGVVALATAWLGVQLLVRLVSRMSRGADVLACWMCDHSGGCHCRLRGSTRQRGTQEVDG